MTRKLIKKKPVNRKPIAVQRTVWIPDAAQAPAEDTPAVITLPAIVDGKWKVTCIRWSYSDDPTGGTIVVAWTDGTARTETYYITTGGPGFMLMDRDLPASAGVTITLSAGGAAILGTIYADVGRQG